MQTYQESGKAGPLAVPAILLLVGGAAAASFLYQRIITWIPLIYVNALITVGFGTGLGLGIDWLMRKARNRNRLLAVCGAVAAGLVATACSFWWAYRMELPGIHKQLVQAALAEGAQADELVSLEDFGTNFTFGDWVDLRVESGWSVGRVASSGTSKPTLSGFLVYVIWLIEAGIIVVLAARRSVRNHGGPFCEACERWPVSRTFGPFPKLDEQALRTAARQGDVDALLRPVPAPGGPATTSGVYLLHSCPHCESGRWLDVLIKRVGQDEKGQMAIALEPLVLGLELSPAQDEALHAYDYPRTWAEPRKGS